MEVLIFVEKTPRRGIETPITRLSRRDTHQYTTLDSYIKFEVAHTNMSFILFNAVEHIYVFK